MKWRTLSGALALILGLPGMQAGATVLTFDGIPIPGSSVPIPQDYGDRVTAATDPVTGWQYGTAGGFTPNVVVEYNPASVTPFSLWQSGYGSLINALGHINFNVLGSVVLRPDAGFLVTLSSFDVGGWSIDRPDSRIVVSDLDGTALFDSGLVTVPGPTSNPSTWAFTGPLSSANGLSIELFDYGTLGLDNVQFSQAPIPEPGTWAMLLGGLGLLSLAVRRRRFGER